MFGGRQQHALLHQTRRVAHPRYVPPVCFNLELLQIHAPEHDSGIRGCWHQPYSSVNPGVESNAMRLGRSLNRGLEHSGISNSSTLQASFTFLCALLSTV